MTMKALIHIDESEKIQLAINNIKNLQKEPLISEVVCVINGDAVTQLVNLKIDSFNYIKVFVCQNSLNAYQIDSEQIDHNYIIVSSGVVHIVKLQEDNYRYIKP